MKMKAYFMVYVILAVKIEIYVYFSHFYSFYSLFFVKNAIGIKNCFLFFTDTY